MERKDFVHVSQDKAFEIYQDGIVFEKDIENLYERNDYLMRRPDLLGKTVMVTSNQFSKVYDIMTKLMKNVNIERPDIYVYEEFYYGAESYGINKPWIEISAKTVQDFTTDELTFVLARELYKIWDGITKQRTMMEMKFKALSMVSVNEVEQISKLSFYKWYRLSNFSADNYGYLACKSVKVAIQSILKMVLNSTVLAEQIDINEFISQASEINKLDDEVSNYTKTDESVPYAPHRVQSIIAYALSERGMKTIQEDY